ncbi:DUF4169 family protein [Pseudorhodobacter aquimaris]|uniref:DUF4169 family protein n=1 Tax=Pseudorhodobacter aquimaris TaxID=687412 RepID=UPI00067D4555|nr:DUF4169 family protein [Pseudorhodobacter aquimaris]
MAADILSLARARKQRDRKARAAQADANAVKFGRTKAEKQADAAAKQKSDRALDGHARDPEDGS